MTISSSTSIARQLENFAVSVNGQEAKGLDREAMQAADSLRGIPVYPDMADKLIMATNHPIPDPDIAHMLAVCSAYSYSNANTLSEIMSLLGLERNICKPFSRVVDGMLIDSTAFLVWSQDGQIAILSYRGTSPLNFNQWLVDLDVATYKIRSPGFPGGSVHAGFYRNTMAIQRNIIKELRSAENLRALYITGHSLGAAMAAIMAANLVSNVRYHEIADKLKAVYVFAQPMVGDSDFAESCQLYDFLREKVFRFIYQNDIVPSLPPLMAGRYQHFGCEYRYRESILGYSSPFTLGFEFPFVYKPQKFWGREPRWVETSGHPARQVLGFHDVANTFVQSVGRKYALVRYIPFRYSIDDHLPHNYIQAVAAAATVPTSEFGQ